MMRDAQDNILQFPLPPRPAGRHLSPRAIQLAQGRQSPHTRKAYQLDWQAWSRWLAERGIAAETACQIALANHLTDMVEAGRALSTIRRRCAGIIAGYRLRRWQPPEGEAVRSVLAGAGRSASLPAPKPARPLTADLLARCIDAMAGDGAATVRDRAILLAGWQGALRLGEIRGLNWLDWVPSNAGGTLILRRTKGARGSGHIQDVPLVPADNPGHCPIGALERWRSLCGGSGAMFRLVDRAGGIHESRISNRTISLVIRRAMERAGIDPAGYSPHSLRSGMLTSAALAGAQPWELMAHSRHRHIESLAKYVREVRRRAEHPARGLL